MAEILTGIELAAKKQADKQSKSPFPKHGARTRRISNTEKPDPEGQKPRVDLVNELVEENEGQKLLDAEKMSGGPEEKLKGTWDYTTPADVVVKLDEDFATGKELSDSEESGEDESYLGSDFDEDLLLEKIDAKNEKVAKDLRKTAKLEAQKKATQERIEQERQKMWSEIESKHGLTKNIINSLNNKNLDNFDWYLRMQEDTENSFKALLKISTKNGKNSEEYKNAEKDWKNFTEQLLSFHKKQADKLDPQKIAEAYSIPYLIRKYNLGTLNASHREFLQLYVTYLLNKRNKKTSSNGNHLPDGRIRKPAQKLVA